MDNAGYVALNRQSGLLAQMQVVANNIANQSTTGFRREGVVFSEFVKATGRDEESLSMAAARTRHSDLAQAPLRQTGGTFDFAIEGEGFFLLETPEEQGLTRAGVFTPSAEGELVTMEGHRLLDAGGAPVFVPPDARSVALGADGTLSGDVRPIGQLGLWAPENPNDLLHREGTRFAVEGEIVPVEGARLHQGFTEGSNVNAVAEITRMVEASRAYEMGQNFLEKEDERIRNVLRVLGR